MLCRLYYRESLRLIRSCSQVNQNLRPQFPSRHAFQTASKLQAVRPYLLADIGEGIAECQIISWSVKPGDRVQQFDTICEVASDKATVDITSRFDGTVKALHYEENDMAIVGKPLIDIDVVDDDLEPEQLPSVEGDQLNTTGFIDEAEVSTKGDIQQPQQSMPTTNTAVAEGEQHEIVLPAKTDSVATPAVRQLLKQHNLSISDMVGTGKGGRVLKEDVERYASKPQHQRTSISATPSKSLTSSSAAMTIGDDHTVQLSPIESQMFKVMTRSLNIPHFQYTHSVDLTNFTISCARLSTTNASRLDVTSKQVSESMPKLTPLPFIMKALSLVFTQFPKLNSHLDTITNPNQPTLTLKASHDFGIAIDTPQGLLVPVIRQVQQHSVIGLAAEIKRVRTLAQEGQLKPEDFQNSTFTISNIGSVGTCGAVGPVIVAPTVGILGIGRTMEVPVFSTDKVTGIEQIVKENQAVLSWSADHRIIDGAMVSRAAEMLSALLKSPDSLGLTLR